MHIKTTFYCLILSTLIIGCGDTKETTSTETHTKDQRASLYINKGNFVEVANFAYKRVTDSSFTEYGMDVLLPGQGLDTPSTYTITTKKDSNNVVKKIIVHNYENSLEIKMMSTNRINVLFQDENFTMNEQLSLDEFITKQKG